MNLVVKKLPNTWLALGLAAHFVAKHETFGRFPAAELIRTLSGQIQAGHYLFAFDMSADPARVVGYYGWALYDSEVAERFAETGSPPPASLPDGGDVIWLLTAVADDRAAFFGMAKAARAIYPHHRVMAVRHKPGRKVTLDQSRARVVARRAGREPS